MEAWLAETLVVANRASEVVAWHCERSEGGLLFDGVEEFAQCLCFAADEPEPAGALARRGRAYVLENYQWDAVLDGVEASLDAWLPRDANVERGTVRILMVSPYPPIRDGIASYTVQEVAALLDAGHEVEVLSPWPSAAHHHLALPRPTRSVRAREARPSLRPCDRPVPP